jgi:hypothetical protein
MSKSLGFGVQPNSGSVGGAVVGLDDGVDLDGSGEGEVKTCSVGLVGVRELSGRGDVAGVSELIDPVFSMPSIKPCVVYSTTALRGERLGPEVLEVGMEEDWDRLGAGV